MDISLITSALIDALRPILEKERTEKNKNYLSNEVWNWIRPLFIKEGEIEILEEAINYPDDDTIYTLNKKLEKILVNNPEEAEIIIKKIDDAFNKIQSQNILNTESSGSINISIDKSISTANTIIGNVKIK